MSRPVVGARHRASRVGEHLSNHMAAALAAADRAWDRRWLVFVAKGLGLALVGGLPVVALVWLLSGGGS